MIHSRDFFFLQEYDPIRLDGGKPNAGLNPGGQGSDSDKVL
jgi:hypothetical protein